MYRKISAKEAISVKLQHKLASLNGKYGSSNYKIQQLITIREYKSAKNSATAVYSIPSQVQSIYLLVGTALAVLIEELRSGRRVLATRDMLLAE